MANLRNFWLPIFCYFSFKINRLHFKESFSIERLLPLNGQLLIIGFIFFSLQLSTAQTITPKIDSLKANVKYKNSVLVAPLVSNTPETGWAFALAGIYIFKTNKKDSLLRTSTIPTGVAYTTRQQLLIAIGGNIFLPKEDYIIRFENTYTQFPDKFWGIGNKTFNRERQDYAFEQFYSNPQFFRKVYGKYYLGVGVEFQRIIKTEYGVNSWFEIDDVVGRKPYQAASLGFLLTYDNRNHAYVPDKGGSINIELYNAALWNFSDYEFQTIRIKAKKFQKVFKNHVLGFHMVNVFTFGEVPYRSLAVLGGMDIMRGYFSGRFRDKMMNAVQVEYRLPIYWRFGAVGFAGVGIIANRFSDYSIDELKYSLGSGLRFAILPKEKLNIRFDVAWGNFNSFNYYLILAESF